MKYKLFCGDTYYPLGGYEDFKGHFASVEAAKKYVEKLYRKYDCVWAQIVLEDEIVQSCIKDIYEPSIWEWKTPDKKDDIFQDEES